MDIMRTILACMALGVGHHGYDTITFYVAIELMSLTKALELSSDLSPSSKLTNLQDQAQCPFRYAI